MAARHVATGSRNATSWSSAILAVCSIPPAPAKNTEPLNRNSSGTSPCPSAARGSPRGLGCLGKRPLPRREVRHARVDRVVGLGIDAGRALGRGGPVGVVADHAVVVALRVALLDPWRVRGKVGRHLLLAEV